MQVLANGLVDHRPGNRQYTSKLRHDRGRRGSRCRHDNGVAQGFEDIGHVEVCAPVAAFGKTGMVRLVDNDKADASRTCKAIAMDRQELRRRENNAGAARSQAGKHVIARRLHGLAGQHANANAERGHRRGKVIGLVGNERAQRIDKDTRTPAKNRLARGMHMEDKRLAAPRSHNGQNTLVIGQGIERLDLRAVRLVRSDKAVNE